MLNKIFPKFRKKIKTRLPNPIPFYKIVFKEGEVDIIKRIKGWRTDQQMADALGVTRAYISMLAKRKVSVSHVIILRLAYLLGNLRENWWTHYEIVEGGNFVDLNHPLYNLKKYQGIVPYAKHSPMADLRQRDYKVERQ